jgi:mannose-6-phosphate isomerase
MKSPRSEEHRPWGYFCVLADEPYHKVKRIVVFPKQRLSLQRHLRRREHWYIVQGSAVVTIDKNQVPMERGQSVDIPQGAWHRIMNTGDENVVVIEVQGGDYFGEDDIERSEDDYGRV